MAKRFSKITVNWAELDKRVPPDQRTKYLAFKAKADAYFRRVQSNPPEPPKINWDEYKKIVPIPGLVEKMQKAYQSFKVPYPEDKYSVKVDEQWKSLEPEIKKYCGDMQEAIDSASKELQRVRALPQFEEMTLEMYCDMFPAQALDPVNRPTFWPHDAEEQLGHVGPALPPGP